MRSKGIVLRLAPLALIASLLVSGAVLPAPERGARTDNRTIVLTESGGLFRSTSAEARPGFSRRIKPPIPTNLVGFSWEGNAAAMLVRGLKNGRWGEWVEIDSTSSEGPDAGTAEYHPGRTFTDPAWLGRGIEQIEVRLAEGNIRNLRMHVVRSDAASGPRIGTADAAPPYPGINSRSQWGADESRRKCGPEYAPDVRFAAVHHTAGSNDYSQADVPAILRGIYHYQVFSRDFCDIGYNFLLDRFGGIWEGRWGGVNKAVQGAHVSGFNYRSTGASVMGNFVNQQIPNATYYALRRLLAWKLGIHGVNAKASTQHTVGGGSNSKFSKGQSVWVNTISGHKELDATACPGQMQNLLPQLRAEVQNDISDGWWQNLGGYLKSAPAVASRKVNQLDIFARGGDDAMWRKGWNGKRWSGWQTLGGKVTSDPSAVSWDENRIDVFSRGADSALWHRFWNGSWSGWNSLGGKITSSPEVVSPGSNLLNVFARGSDDGLWMVTFDGLQWSGWQQLGGKISSAPGATTFYAEAPEDTLIPLPQAPPSTAVFAKGMDNAMWHRIWNGSSWGPWRSIGGQFKHGPAATSSNPAKIELFGVGLDSAGWTASRNNNKWGAWATLAGRTTSDPSAVSWGPGRVDVFVRGKNYELLHRWSTNGKWNI